MPASRVQKTRPPERRERDPRQAAPAGGAGEAPGEVRPDDLVEVGFLRGAYGLKGWVHVQPYSADGQVLRGARRWWLYGPGMELPQDERALAAAVTGVREHAAGLVAKWRGCDDPEAAQACKGWRIAVSRSDFPRLPEGEYYWVDLIGAQVVNRAGQAIGTVAGLRSNGVHDVLEVAREGAAATLIPMVPAYVDGIDLGERRIRVDWEADW